MWCTLTLALALTLTLTLTLTLMQVMWWIQRLQGRTRRAVEAPSYMLLGQKLTYGVDYGNYLHQLAAEMGAAPSVSSHNS